MQSGVLARRTGDGSKGGTQSRDEGGTGIPHSADELTVNGEYVLTPPGIDPIERLRPAWERCAAAGGDQGRERIRSLWASVRDVFFPVKLPPLVLESKPIAVPDRMATKRSASSTAVAIGAHVFCHSAGCAPG